MTLYYLIYYNSLKAQFLMSLTSESAWFAALSFGGYNMTLATLAAFAGSLLGLAINFSLGYYISRWRAEVPIYSEALYSRISAYFNRYLYAVMAVPQLFILEILPGYTIFVLVCGLFRVRPVKAICALALSRALFYGYYLMQSAQLL